MLKRLFFQPFKCKWWTGLFIWLDLYFIGGTNFEFVLQRSAYLLMLLPVCSFKEGSEVCDVSEVKRSTFGFLLGVGALQLQLLQSGGQIFFLFGGQVLHVETVVIEQQSQSLQWTLYEYSTEHFNHWRTHLQITAFNTALLLWIFLIRWTISFFLCYISQEQSFAFLWLHYNKCKLDNG